MQNNNSQFAILDNKNIVCSIVAISTTNFNESYYQSLFLNENQNLYVLCDLEVFEEDATRGIVSIGKTVRQQQNETIVDNIVYHFYIKIKEDKSNIISFDVDPNIISFDLNVIGANNSPVLEYTYDAELNAFISPKQEETYILNKTTYEWEPDPNLTYDLHGDGKLYQYQPEEKSWLPTWDPE